MKREKHWRRNGEKLGFLAIALVCLTLICVRTLYLSPYARSWDDVDFALALDRFDLLAMQPHFPGYPYFILGGMAVHRWVADPVKALTLWNVVMTGLSSVPIYLLLRRYVSPLSGMAGLFFIQSFSYLWLISMQPMSEATAVAVLWWYLWSLDRGFERNAMKDRFILPAFMFGLLMGVRLSFAPFGLGLLALAWRDMKENRAKRYRRIAFFAACGLFFQAVWVAGLIVAEGGMGAFWLLAKGFVGGHFEDWGGTVVTSQEPFAARVLRLVVYNLLWTGLFGQSFPVAVGYGALAAFIVYRCLKKRSASGSAPATGGWRLQPFLGSLLLMLLVYGLWAIVGQNVDKPRHISPLIGPIGFLFYLVSAKAGRATIAAVMALALLQTSVGVDLVRRQAAEKPAVYQLAQALAGRKDGFVLYTWEETRVLQYVHAPFPHQRILTFPLFLEQVKDSGEQTVLLTGHVLQGFEVQAGDLSERVQPVAEFQSDPIFDPVYHHIIVYEWKK